MEQQTSDISFPASALPPLVKDLGLLVGVLQEHGTNVSINFEWFSDPVPHIQNIPHDGKDLLNVLRDVLGKKAPISPDGNSWYPISFAGKPTPVYVILPGKKAQSGTVALGLHHSFLPDDAPVSVDGFVKVPLVNLPLTDPVVVTGQKGSPIAFVLDVTTKTKFHAGDETFTGLSFEGDFAFAAPAFKLTFTDLSPSNPQSTQTTLKGLLEALTTLGNWINPLLDVSQIKQVLNTPIPSTSTKVGQVFVDLGVLADGATAGTYVFGSFSKLKTLANNPEKAGEWILAEVLKVLASREEPIVKLGDEGGVYIASSKADDKTTDYGLRVTVPDIVLTGKASDAAEPDQGNTASPTFKLQLGKWLTGENDKANWATRSNPSAPAPEAGLSVFVIRETDTDGTMVPSVGFRMEMVSIGFDFAGGENTPLVSVAGFGLGGVEPRYSFTFDAADTSKMPWGLAVRADKLELPFGNAASGASGNPVASNLLSNGDGSDKDGADKDGADNSAVAPAFSVAVAYSHDPGHNTDVNVQLFDDKDQPSDKVILPIQRSFGPIFCQNLGLGWAQPNPDYDLSVLFDGNVKVAVLDVGLKELSVDIPLKTPGDPSKYKLGLEGLDFELKAGPVDISGGLFKDTVTVDGAEILEYNGEALIKVGDTWNISAMGSWAQVEGHPSLFVFLILDAPIGGPAFFFITGLSGGFGYNRALKLPAQDEVQTFPLVAGLTNPSAVGGKDASPADALKKLKDFVPPAQGVNFIAAGVQFTSFELIKSNALLVVEFGRKFEIALLGLSRIQLPQEGTRPLAYVELGLEVLFLPDEGEISATLQITPNSYVLTPDCKLTGGFAFVVWFDPNDHAGDFVLTVGGYSPYFRKPDWYPDEPRLGFNWKVSNELTMKGGAYFALTPSAVMAGGALDVQFRSGSLHAWLTAHADFLIQWKPVHYVVSIGVSIGVSLTVHVLFVKATIKVEVGADLDIWGPPIGGVAKVHLWIISFSIGFGAGQDAGQMYVSLDDFATLLPQKKGEEKEGRSVGAAANSAAPKLPFDNVVRLRLTGGHLPIKDDSGTWYIRESTFKFDLETVWPLTAVTLEGPDGATQIDAPTLGTKDPNAPSCARAEDGYFVGVRPMGVTCATSTLSIHIQDHERNTGCDLSKGWAHTVVTKSVPDALWGTPIAKGGTPKAEAKLLPGRLTGLSGIGPVDQPMAGPAPIPEDNLAHDILNPTVGESDLLPVPQPAQTTAPRADKTSLQDIANTAVATKPKRDAIFDALGNAGYAVGENQSLAPFVEAIGESFAAAPMLGEVAA